MEIVFPCRIIFVNNLHHSHLQLDLQKCRLHSLIQTSYVRPVQLVIKLGSDAAKWIFPCHLLDLAQHRRSACSPRCSTVWPGIDRRSCLLGELTIRKWLRSKVCVMLTRIWIAWRCKILSDVVSSDVVKYCLKLDSKNIQRAAVERKTEKESFKRLELSTGLRSPFKIGVLKR